jgi:hypothetical protein
MLQQVDVVWTDLTRPECLRLSPPTFADATTMSSKRQKVEPTTLKLQPPIDVVEFEKQLEKQHLPVKVDARHCYLPIEAVGVAISFLRRYEGTSVYLGHNSFSFSDFYLMLETKQAKDLFASKRLRVVESEFDQQIETLAATKLDQGDTIQLADVNKTLDMMAKQHQAWRESFDAEANEWRERVKKAEDSWTTRHGGNREELKQVRQRNDNADRVLELSISQAVYEALDEPKKLVIEERYKFLEQDMGDMDGMVVGKFKGNDVIVFIEAKTNMDSCYNKATKELDACLRYWELLCSGEGHPDDQQHLHVSDYKEHEVMFAFGGAKFGSATQRKAFTRKNKVPCFCVVPGNAQGYVVKSQ